MTKTEMLNRLYQVKVSMRATLVLNYLINRANAELTCFPAIKTIAKDCNMSGRTVQRALGDLSEVGLLEKDSRYRDNGGQSSNLYTLCLENGHSMSELDDKIETENENSEPEGNREDSGVDVEIDISVTGFLDYEENMLIVAESCGASKVKLLANHKNKNIVVGHSKKQTICAFKINSCQGVGVNLVPP